MVNGELKHTVVLLEVLEFVHWCTDMSRYERSTDYIKQVLARDIPFHAHLIEQLLTPWLTPRAPRGLWYPEATHGIRRYMSTSPLHVFSRVPRWLHAHDILGYFSRIHSGDMVREIHTYAVRK
jgi:hypothetical protein